MRIEKGLVLVAFQAALIERRLDTPNRTIQDPPRPVHVPLLKSICKEHRQLRRCLHILGIEIQIRLEILQFASNSGWHQSALL